MMTLTESIQASNERTFELLTSLQESILEATKAHVAALAGTAAEFAAIIPTPEPVETFDPKDLIEENFKFQSRLLEVNRSFALALTDALNPEAPVEVEAEVAAATAE